MSETIEAAIARLTREIAERQAILDSLRALVKLPAPLPFTHYDGVTGCTCPPYIAKSCTFAGCPRRPKNVATMGGHG